MNNITPIFKVLNLNLSRTKFLAIILLFAPSFAWLYILNIEMFQFAEMIGTHATPDFFWIFTGKILFLTSIVVSALIGSLISQKLNQKKFFGAWILSGVVTTMAFTFFQELPFFLILSVLSGISFGIGFPSCLAFVADSTTVENRARVSGITMFSTYVLMILLIALSLQLELIQAVIVISIFRALSFIALIIDPFEHVSGRKRKWQTILKRKGFRFYFISWLLFNAANGISYFVEPIQNTESLTALAVILTYVGVAGIGLISGFISDRYGRRKTIIFGIGTFAISYAVLSFFAEPVTWLITQLFYGIAVGIFLVNYYLTVIGDFTERGSREKIYAIAGVVPFILSMTFELFSQIFSISISPSQISSIVTILLIFGSFILIFAPETLPEKIMQRKAVTEHLKKAKEMVDKKSLEKTKHNDKR